MPVGNFAAIKQNARQAVHNLAAVQVYYTDAVVVTPQPFGVRWHNKLMADLGNLESGGYAQVIEGVDSLVFDIAEVAASGVTLRRGGQVNFPDYGLTFTLDTLVPTDGPVNLKWMAVRNPT